MAELDSQDWRNKYDQLGKRYQNLYRERMPVLHDYENMVRGSLTSLIDETLPAAKDYFAQAKQAGSVVSDEYLTGAREYISSARGYDTPEKRQLATQSAMTDVSTAGEAARKSSIAQLESFGIDPSMTRSASLDQNARLQTALEAVKQGRDAATGVEERGRAYMADAMRVGAGVQAGQFSATGAASGMLQSATQLGNQTAETFGNIFGTPMQNLAARKGLTDASLQAKQMEQASKVDEGSPWGAIGQTVGTAAGIGLGAYLTPGNPLGGAELGAQLGSQLGGTAGSTASRGSATQYAQRMQPIY